MKVQVELKGHPLDKDFEENVLKVINDTGMHDNVMVIAQDARRLPARDGTRSDDYQGILHGCRYRRS